MLYDKLINDQVLNTGVYEEIFDAENISTGVYFYLIEMKNRETRETKKIVKKMLLIK